MISSLTIVISRALVSPLLTLFLSNKLGLNPQDVGLLLGIAVFSGMLGVTAFGIFFTPVFYSVIRKLTEQKPAAPVPAPHSTT